MKVLVQVANWLLPFRQTTASLLDEPRLVAVIIPATASVPVKLAVALIVWELMVLEVARVVTPDTAPEETFNVLLARANVPVALPMVVLPVLLPEFINVPAVPVVLMLVAPRIVLVDALLPIPTVVVLVVPTFTVPAPPVFRVNVPVPLA